MKLIMIIVALLLAACSQTPTVHLYTRYLTKDQVTQIEQVLSANNMQVKPNDLAFPASITHSSLTYSPVIDDPNAVRKVLDAMQNIGWPIHHTSMLFVDNHWYKENSLALMLVPPEVDPQRKNSSQDIANQYSSENCELTISIHLDKNGQYKIHTSGDHQIDAELTQGSWQITEFPYLALYSIDDNWPMFFELQQYKTNDQISEIQITELIALSNYSFLGGCSFKYGLRS
ncbi:hypothetical protein [Paraglaciecola aestuariivivens]